MHQSISFSTIVLTNTCAFWNETVTRIATYVWDKVCKEYSCQTKRNRMILFNAVISSYTTLLRNIHSCTIRIFVETVKIENYFRLVQFMNFWRTNLMYTPSTLHLHTSVWVWSLRPFKMILRKKTVHVRAVKYAHLKERCVCVGTRRCHVLRPVPTILQPP